MVLRSIDFPFGKSKNRVGSPIECGFLVNTVLAVRRVLCPWRMDTAASNLRRTVEDAGPYNGVLQPQKSSAKVKYRQAVAGFACDRERCIKTISEVRPQALRGGEGVNLIRYKNVSELRRRVLQLQRFRGVDFRSTDTQVDNSRSPDALNMMAGENVYFPVKRPGYRRFEQAIYFGAPNGLYHYRFQENDYLLLHVGHTLARYRVEGGEIGDGVLVSDALADAVSDGFIMNDCFWLLDGSTFWRYDGEELLPASEFGYVPLTSVARLPSGGGTVLEPVNLLTGWRYNSFAADGESKEFYLDAKELDEEEVSALVGDVLMKEGEGFSVDRAAGKLIFDNAPEKFLGADNVTVEFCKTVDGYADRINRCRFAQLYGGRNDTRVFLSGNPEERNVDRYSGLYDPTYFPDVGYTRIGSDASAIMGYAKQYDSMIVIKDGVGGDAAMYLRTCSFDEEGEIFFPLLQGAAGEGCVSSASVAVFEDTPLYVSANGVRAVVGTEVYEQRNIKSRSNLIDSRLVLQNLERSCGCVHDGRYYLAVDGVCYVADLRQVSADASGVDGGLQYEWYYWDNIPAKRMLSFGGYLWMLGEHGALYRFYRFEEKGIYNDDGVPIKAYWTTPLLRLDEGLAECNVSGVSLLLQPMQHSGCVLSAESDGVGFDEQFAPIDRRYLDLIDLEDVDFNRFSFSALYQPKWEHFGLRRRKTRQFAVRIENDLIGDGLGIYRIAIEYKTGGNG